MPGVSIISKFRIPALLLELILIGIEITYSSTSFIFVIWFIFICLNFFYISYSLDSMNYLTSLNC